MSMILSRDELIDVVNKARAAGNSIVLANGAFDIFHVGHLRYLRGAKEEGDVLVVAINDDDSVRSLKGEGRPIMPIEDRMKIVAAMEPVDYVTSFSEPTVENILLAIRPDVYAKGADHTEDTVPEKDIVASYGGRVAIVGDPKVHSSTDFIEQLSKDET